jgi:hypothetical protein
MSLELVNSLVWPNGMPLEVRQVWAKLLAQVLVPIHAALRNTGVNDYSDMVNRAAVHECSDNEDLCDSLPFQDLTARMLTLEKRICNLEAFAIQERVPSEEAHFSAAFRSSRAEYFEDDVKLAQRRAARLRSPSPLVRPVYEHSTGGYTLLPQSAISKLVAAGVIEEEMGGRLVRMPPQWNQPQHNQEVPNLQEEVNPHMQPQMQTQTAQHMLVVDQQLHSQMQSQMPSGMMLVAGQQLQPHMQPQQMQPLMPPHMLFAGQQLQSQMQSHMEPQTAPSQSR